MAGDWVRALSASLEVEAMLKHMENSPSRAEALTARVCILTSRGQLQAADFAYQEVCSSVAPSGSTGRQAEMTRAIIGHAEALLANAHNDSMGGREAIERLLGHPDPSAIVDSMPEAVRIALRFEARTLAQRLAGLIDPALPLACHALEMCGAELLEDECDWTAGAVKYGEAAAGWHDFGVPHEDAHALLGQGRCLVVLGRAQEAAQPLQQAREIFESLGAKPSLKETDKLLQQVRSA